MKRRSGMSLRATLILVFSISIVVPSFLIMIIMPVVYNRMITQERHDLTDVIVQLVNKYLDDYLDAMERETIIPYFSPEFARALRERNTAVSGSDILARRRSDDLLMRVMQNAMWVYRSDIVSSVLVVSDGRAFAVSRKWGASNVADTYDPKRKSWYEAAVAADGRAVFVPPHAQDYLEEPTVPLVFSVARLIRDPDTQSPLGVIMVDQNTAGIDRVLGELDLGLDSILLLTEKGGAPLYSTQALPVEVQEDLLAGRSFMGSRGEWFGVEAENDRFGWRIVMLLSEQELAWRAGSVVVVGALFILGSVVSGLLAFVALSRRVTAPIEALMQALSRVQDGDLGTRTVPEGVREARELGMAFNQMIARIQRLIDEEYRTQLSLKEAEYQSLQAQLQPHFLYNVLYSLLGLNQLGEKAALESAIYDLHDMLRYSLEQGLWSTLGQELDFLGHYCTLQKLRFQERLVYSIEAGEELRSLRIPRLLLQPLVENAIIHGVEPLARPCHVRVAARSASIGGRQWLVCEVIDDGTGFDPGTARESPSTKGHGLGLELVRERLDHGFVGARLHVDTAPGQGTRIMVEIPL